MKPRKKISPAKKPLKKSARKPVKKSARKPSLVGHNQHGAAETRELLAMGSKYYVPNYKPRQMIIDRGKGSRIWDLEGNDYIDFGAGIAVCALGYADKGLIN